MTLNRLAWYAVHPLTHGLAGMAAAACAATFAAYTTSVTLAACGSVIAMLTLAYLLFQEFGRGGLFRSGLSYTDRRAGGMPQQNYNVPVRRCEQCQGPMPITVPPYQSFCCRDCLFDWCATAGGV